MWFEKKLKNCPKSFDGGEPIKKEDPPIWPPIYEGDKNVKIKGINQNSIIAVGRAWNVGNTIITKDFIEQIVNFDSAYTTIAGISKPHLSAMFHNASDTSGDPILNTTTYEYQEGSSDFAQLGNVLIILNINGNAVAILHNKINKNAQLTRYTVIDYKCPLSVVNEHNYTIFANNNKESGIIYVTL